MTHNRIGLDLVGRDACTSLMALMMQRTTFSESEVPKGLVEPWTAA